jgi:RNA polymerase sigma-70 factor (ECF subfamily)
MQEVAVVLWEKFAQFRTGGDFRAWAFGVARFEVLAWLRDKGRDRLTLREDVVQMLADETALAESHLAQQREALESCLGRLARPQRELLMEAY